MNCCDIIKAIAGKIKEGSYTFPKGVCPKVNVREQLKFEFVYDDSESVVAGSISSGGDYGIHCWWDLIRSKQLSSVPIYRA